MAGDGEGRVSGHPIAARLRAATSGVHRRLEDELDLLAPDLTVARYTTLLERFHGWHAVLEPRLDAWHDAGHDAGPALDWPSRRKLALAEADLIALGTDPAGLPRCPHVPEVGHTAHALGALYVVEGATLGGRLVQRALAGRVPTGTTRLLGSYGPDVGRRWREWGRTTQCWVGDDELRADAVVAHAVRTFDALRSWLAPARRRAAA